MGIKIMVEIPTPERSERAPSPMSPEDRIRRYIELVESGHESSVEWLVLNKMYKDLCSRKKSPRIQNLIDMIKPVLAKYGYHDVTAGK